ncbi:uridylate kinase [Phytomonospora sp. NPDC050363]|uniref:uridylate kinase n=1 Tax=Phytomonospora sp. NPDC050363 TaxID=3155642 RepID=UPI0033D7F0AD
MRSGTREDLLAHLTEAITAVTPGHPTRVAIDGPPAAGKTTLGDELGAVLRAQGRQVIRVSIESFLYPRSRRYVRGADSPIACYEDSFDFDNIHGVLLTPLGPGGDRQFRDTVYDNVADIPLAAPFEHAAPDTVLLFDGVFLMRPELIDGWDLRIFVSAAFEETIARGRVRDKELNGSADKAEARFRARYIPSQQRYFDTIKPTELADIVVHNDKPRQPSWEDRTR